MIVQVTLVVSIGTKYYYTEKIALKFLKAKTFHIIFCQKHNTYHPQTKNVSLSNFKSRKKNGKIFTVSQLFTLNDKCESENLGTSVQDIK